MGTAKDYQKDLNRLLDTTKHDADYISGKLSQEALKSWQKRGREVGIRFGDFSDRFMKDHRQLLADIMALENKKKPPQK